MVLFILSGAFLWASPQKVATLIWVPRLANGKRTFYRDLHSSLGLYSIIFLLFFTFTGLSWSGVWGSKIVQAWSSFPAQKNPNNIQLSVQNHASLNQGVMEEMPWNLEQGKMPLSRDGSKFNQPLVMIDLNTVTAIAEQFQLQRY